MKPWSGNHVESSKVLHIPSILFPPSLVQAEKLQSRHFYATAKTLLTRHHFYFRCWVQKKVYILSLRVRKFEL